ncbi:hypothetical protein ACJX0J_026491, partial [Zea mays]
MLIGTKILLEKAKMVYSIHNFVDSLIDGVLIDNEVTMMILSILTIYRHFGFTVINVSHNG